MSNHGRMPYHSRVNKIPPGSRQRATGTNFAFQPGYDPRNSAHQQQPYAYPRDGGDGRMADQPSTTFSNANRDRGLSNVFASNLGDPLQYPPSSNASNAPIRLPQSSAGYQEIPDVASQNMSMSEGPTGVFHEPERFARPFLPGRGPSVPASRQTPHSAARRITGMSSGPDPQLHIRFRRVSDALADEGIRFPSRSSQLTADHAIQAFAHFYQLFLPLPVDFPLLDFTLPADRRAPRLKAGIEAVNGLLEDLNYDDRRQTVAELANLNMVEHPHRTVSALFWLLDLSSQARFGVIPDDQEPPSMDQSLEYSEYAVRMLFASSVSTSPATAVMEARTYIQGALSRFKSDKQEAITKNQNEIARLEREQDEESKQIAADAARLAELERRRSQLEQQKENLTSSTNSSKMSRTSVESALDRKRLDLGQAQRDFDAMKTKLAESGIDSPETALDLAASMRSKQAELEQLESEHEATRSAVQLEQHQPVSDRLAALHELMSDYNNGVEADLALPTLPSTVEELMGKSSSDFLTTETAFSLKEKWRTHLQKSETHKLRRLIADTENKIKDVSDTLASSRELSTTMRSTIADLRAQFQHVDGEVQQLAQLLRNREDQVENHSLRPELARKSDDLRSVIDRLRESELKNSDLEEKMRKCANRKREIRVLLETYKAAYARIIEGIGQRETAIRQQEQTVANLRRVLQDFTPPNMRERGLS